MTVPKLPDPATEGDALLGDVKSWLGTYISTMHEEDLDILTLWCVHTHLAQETYTTPRLILDSPVPGSGKTTVLDHFQRLAVRPVQAASLSSPALLVRILNDGIRTILIDEADRALDPKKEGVGELIAVLNSGYRVGATRPVLVPAQGGDWASKEMPTYAPVVMAGNNPALPDDTRSRSIRVLLFPDLHGTVDDSDWELLEEDAQQLAARITDWAEAVRDEVRATRPPMPEGIRGRLAEKWRPMKRVAVVSGGRWPEVVDRLALRDLEQIEADKEDGLLIEKPHVALVRDLIELWPEDTPLWESRNIVAQLAIHDDDKWGYGSPFGKPITTKRLGKMLATGYGINSTRLERGGPRGYLRSDLARAHHRIIGPPTLGSGANGAHGASGANTGSAPDTPDAPHAPDTGEGGGSGAAPICSTCAAPTDNHLPGCPSRLDAAS